MNDTNDWLPITDEEAVSQAAEEALSAAQPAAAPAADAQEKPEAEEAVPGTEAPAPQAEEPRSDAIPVSAETDAADREAAEARLRAEAVRAGWEREAAAMREIYPDFDLCAAIEEPGDFARLLKAGIGVRRAYEASHLEEILGAAMRYAALRAGQLAAQTIDRQRARPQENPVCSRAAVRTATDVNSLTRSDILRILGEVSRGARITFK